MPSKSNSSQLRGICEAKKENKLFISFTDLPGEVGEYQTTGMGRTEDMGTGSTLT